MESSSLGKVDLPAEHLVERFGQGPDCLADRRPAILSPEWREAELVCNPGFAEGLPVLVEHCHIAVRLVVGSQDYFEEDSQDYSEEDSQLVRLEEDSRPVTIECQPSSRVSEHNMKISTNVSRIPSRGPLVLMRRIFWPI